MKTKFLKVLDSGTEMSFLLIQFQESEKEFLDAAGKSTETKILLNLSDNPITCISGYGLNERHGYNISNLTKEMEPSGTINGLKEIVHKVTDINYLPDVLNVKEARWAFNHTRFNEEDELTELLDRVYQDEEFGFRLEKALFQRDMNSYLVIVRHKDSDSIIYENSSTSSSQKELFSEYLWIPVNEISDSGFIKSYEIENNLIRVTI